MNETVRGLVLLVSVVLWLPFLRPVLDGALTVEQGLLRYAGTLLLAWAGGAGLSALVHGYVMQGEQRGSEQREAPGTAQTTEVRRRADDVTS